MDLTKSLGFSFGGCASSVLLLTDAYVAVLCNSQEADNFFDLDFSFKIWRPEAVDDLTMVADYP